MRRGQVGVLLAVTSGLFSVLLAVAVNVATGGSLPGSLQHVAWLAWPAVGVLGLIGVGLAVWQQHLASAPAVEAPGVPADAVPAAHAASAQSTWRPPGELPAAAVQSARRRPGELPAAAVLVGRDSVVREVAGSLVGGAVIVVAAAPGVGKTALALRVAHDVRGRFPDGQLYASLRGGGGEPLGVEVVLCRFLTALGEPANGSADELAARFRSCVADQALVVVLDDARDVAQVRPLLPGGARCAALVTSRGQLAELDGARVVGLGGLTAADGLALLADIVGAERIERDIDGARQLVAACGGLPLAVRIAGGRLRARGGWTASQLAARLADERGRLDELRQGDRAVRATFRGAYDGLRDIDQIVFRRAGSHPGNQFGIGVAAARAGLSAGAVGDSLERLADVFLVESPAPGQYQIHDLLRLFAGEMVDSAGERKDVAGRGIAYLETSVDGAALLLREAFTAGLRSQVRAVADRVAPQLDDPYARLAVWQLFAEALPDDEGVARARALRWVSHSWTFIGEVRRALPPATEAVALAEAGGDRWEIAQCSRRLGEALRDLERPAEAEAALLRALDVFAVTGPVEEEIEVRAALGVLYNNDGRHEESRAVLLRAHELLPPGVRDSRRGWVLLPLALSYRLSGDLELAGLYAAEATALAREIGDRYLLGYCHQDAAWLAVDAGDLDAAEGDFAAMLELFRGLRVESGVASAIAGLGVVAARRGDTGAAERAFGAAEELFQRLGDEGRAELWRGHRAGVR
ncbi:ATP-binding protein [Dactylosporangium sp. NPDC051541]|uniref:ATP-binding protein n=1 Tax=Dactylosporangium sp. NPDC051541 TaxID=3363977 RepID=UPI0037A7A17E